jgi:hypothetical protein
MRRPEELPGAPDLIEAESSVEVPRPDFLVGNDEDVPRACLPRRLDGSEDDRASDSSRNCSRVPTCSTRVVSLSVQLAVAREPAIDAGGEESRPDHKDIREIAASQLSGCLSDSTRGSGTNRMQNVMAS